MSGKPSAPLAIRVMRVPGAPVVAARLWLWGGARHEEIPGLGAITGRLLSEGTRRRDHRTIARQAEDRGMLVKSFASADALGLSIEALAPDWPVVLDWIAEMVLEPTFPEDRRRLLCRQAAAELESLMDQGDVRAAWAFSDQLYHPHPYGRPSLGHPQTLARIEREHVLELHGRALGWGGSLMVAGDVEEEAVARRLEEIVAAWPAEHRSQPEVSAPVGRAVERREVPIPPGEQAHLYLGHLTLPRTHPDLPALDLVGIVLGAGSGLGGRLPQRIRDKEGLAYHVEVMTTAAAGLDPGRLAIYVGTSPETLEKAEASVREELGRLVEEGLGDDEVEEAKSYLMGRDPFRRETARQWADLMSDAALYGLRVDRPEWIAEVVAELDRAKIEGAMRRWIRPEQLRVTIGRPVQGPRP